MICSSKKSYVQNFALQDFATFRTCSAKCSLASLTAAQLTEKSESSLLQDLTLRHHGNYSGEMHQPKMSRLSSILWATCCQQLCMMQIGVSLRVSLSLPKTFCKSMTKTHDWIFNLCLLDSSWVMHTCTSLGNLPAGSICHSGGIEQPQWLTLCFKTCYGTLPEASNHSEALGNLWVCQFIVWCMVVLFSMLLLLWCLLLWFLPCAPASSLSWFAACALDHRLVPSRCGSC